MKKREAYKQARLELSQIVTHDKRYGSTFIEDLIASPTLLYAPKTEPDLIQGTLIADHPQEVQVARAFGLAAEIVPGKYDIVSPALNETQDNVWIKDKLSTIYAEAPILFDIRTLPLHRSPHAHIYKLGEHDKDLRLYAYLYLTMTTNKLLSMLARKFLNDQDRFLRNRTARFYQQDGKVDIDETYRILRALSFDILTMPDVLFFDGIVPSKANLVMKTLALSDIRVYSKDNEEINEELSKVYSSTKIYKLWKWFIRKNVPHENTKVYKYEKSLSLLIETARNFAKDNGMDSDIETILGHGIPMMDVLKDAEAKEFFERTSDWF